MTENDIESVVVDAALKIHKTLGPGLLESVYQATLSFELRKRGWLLSGNLVFQCATKESISVLAFGWIF